MTRPVMEPVRPMRREPTAEIVAGDHGIPDVVTLLEKVTDKKWDGEDQDVGQGTSLRHIPGLPLFGRTHVVKTPISFVGMHIACQHTP